MNKSDLYIAQEEFLKKLTANAENVFQGNGVLLCGGTALARCYLDHRVSYDLDFFIDKRFNPESLARSLGACGITLEGIQAEDSSNYVTQLFGFCQMGKTRLKVSFIEDNYASMFKFNSLPVGDVNFNVEELDGLYHRKLRTVSGSGNSDHQAGGRQAARDLFDLYMLDATVKPIPAFIDEINALGANFPRKAFMAGLGAMPWNDMIDEFSQMDINVAHPGLKHIKKNDLMSLVRLRANEIFKEMTHGQNIQP